MSPEFDRLSALFASDPRQHLSEFAVFLAQTLEVGDPTVVTRFPVAVRLCAMRKHRGVILARLPQVEDEDIDRWIANIEVAYRAGKVAEAPDDKERVAAQELWLGKACHHLMNAVSKADPQSVAAFCRELDMLYSAVEQRRLLEWGWANNRSFRALLWFIPDEAKLQELLWCLGGDRIAQLIVCMRLRKALRQAGELAEHILNEYPAAIQYRVLWNLRLPFTPKSLIRKTAVGLSKELGIKLDRQQRLAIRRLVRKSVFMRKMFKQ